MYRSNYIRDIMKEYIGGRENKFVIYPFGANGVNVRNVLRDYFNIEPCLIVDNEHSKYNSKIIDKKELERVYQEDMFVILTAENNILNAKIMEELSRFVPAENIINLCSGDKREQKRVYDGKGFMLKDFLPHLQPGLQNKKESAKIKVRIVHRSATSWNAISSICSAFKNDEIFDVLLIVHTDWTKKQSISQVEQNCVGGGDNYVTWDEYRVEMDKPDILIISTPWDMVIDGLVNSREFVKLIIVAYWAVVRYNSSVDGLVEQLKETLGVYRPDYYLFDSLLYRELKDLDFFSDKIVEMGNAKFDGIYQVMKEKQYIAGWEKLKEKKVVLWITSHGLGSDRTPGRGLTFDLYAKTIFEYMNRNREMGLIFRPSIGFIREMIQMGFWSQNDLRRLQKYCFDSPNIIYDETDTYDISYSLADGILTDAFGGSVCSALPMLKPICGCYRSENDKAWHKELLDSLYSAYASEDIVSFFEMIKENRDPMFLSRKEASEKFVKNFDGKNGWRIKEFIKEKYFELV